MSNSGLRVPFDDIPASWDTVALEEIATSKRGLTYSSSNLTGPDEGYPYFNLNSFSKEGGYDPDGIKYYKGEFRSDKQTTPDDLLIANTDLTPGGDVIGAPALVPDDYADTRSLASHHVNILHLDTNVDKRFLHYLLCTSAYRNMMRSISAGTTVLNLDKTSLMKIQVPLPPLPEQRRIAEILDAADEAIRQTERVIAKLREVKKGLLHDLLTRGLDADGNLRDPDAHPEQFKDSPLGRIPQEWEIADLPDLMHPHVGIKPGPFGSSLTKSMYTPEGYRVYGQEQVIAGDLAVGDYYVPEIKYLELQSFAVEEDDILMSLVGTVGEVLVVRSPFEPGIINPRLIRLRPDKLKAHTNFLQHALGSPLLHRQLSQMAQGGTMPILSGTIMKQVKLATPPLEEQRRIAAVLDAHDARIRAEVATLDKLRQVKRGLMDDLLTGRVRVG